MISEPTTEEVLAATQQCLSERPDARGLDARTISLVLFFRRYLEVPPSLVMVEAALQEIYATRRRRGMRVVADG